MSSSKEILVFRRILLNPVTCMQFQHFVSLKGDFLENDVLFWLEVQRYKVKEAKNTCDPPLSTMTGNHKIEKKYIKPPSVKNVFVTSCVEVCFSYSSSLCSS